MAANTYVPKVRDVSTVPCPAAPKYTAWSLPDGPTIEVQPHRIEAVKGGREFRCIYCRETWADLDAQVRS